MLAACCQITSTANIAHNIHICRNVRLPSAVLIKGNSSSGLRRRQGTRPCFHSPIQAVFLPEASDFIARNAAETVQITKDSGSIDQNAFVKGLQEQAIESSVSVTAGVHLPTHSESHVCPSSTGLSAVREYSNMDIPLRKD